MKFYDTSALLSLGEQAFTDNFVISDVTLRELEDIKTSGRKTEEIRYKARQATRLLAANSDKYQTVHIPISEVNDSLFKLGLEYSHDNEIMLAALQLYKDANTIFVTDDLCCENIAKDIFKIPIERTRQTALASDVYKGWQEVQLEDGGEEALAAFYQDPAASGINLNNTPTNGYLIIKGPDNETVGMMRWDGTRYIPIKYKNLNTQFGGKVRPLNDEQRLAFDLLQDQNITIKLLLGIYGSGKDYLMVNHALDLIEKGKVDKIVWVRNNIEVKDTKELGFLPGDMISKIAPMACPLSDNLGGQLALERAIMDGWIELQHLGYIRGRSFKRAIIYCSEAENLTKEHIQLLIGRVGEGSMLWLNGDLRQIDATVFESNNGVRKLVAKLTGDEHFGVVYLSKSERSETARLADKLDD